MGEKRDILNLLELIDKISKPDEEVIKLNVNYLIFIEDSLEYKEYIFNKLEKENVLKVIYRPEVIKLFFSGYIYKDLIKLWLNQLYYHFKKGKNFKPYYETIKKEVSEEEDREVVYEVTLNERGDRVFIYNRLENKKIPYKRYYYGSDNILIMKFFLNNQKKRFTKKEIEKGIGTKLNKKVAEMPRDLGFTDIFNILFFSVSKSKIEFISQITRKDVKGFEADISKILEGKKKF